MMEETKRGASRRAAGKSPAQRLGLRRAKHAKHPHIPLGRALALVGIAAALTIGMVAGSSTLTAYSTEKSPKSGATSSGQPASFEKTEVVYATLSAEGALEDAYIVNQFDVSGEGDVIDFGAYESVQNLTSVAPIALADGEVSFVADKGPFYYQGNLRDAVLPWNVRLSYELDGRSIRPADLAGRSGDLRIRVVTTPASGISRAFYDSYMLQVTFTLNGDTTSDIRAEGAAVASAGRDRTVAFTVLPGRNADCVLTAHVEDFEMTGVQFAALPYSMVMEIPDTSSMEGQMQELSDSIGAINDGMAELTAGSVEFGDGLELVAQGAPEIARYSRMISAGLSKLSAGITVENMRDVAAGLDGTADALEGYAAALDGYRQAVAGLLGAYEALSVEEQQALVGLMSPASGLSADQQSALMKLYKAHVALGQVRGVLNADQGGGVTLMATMELVCGTVDQQGSLRYLAAQLRTISSGMYSDDPDAQTLAVAAAGLRDLSEQYAKLDESIALFADGVLGLSSNYALLEEGTYDLASGVSLLNDAAIDIPAAMREEIDAMMADYEFPEFAPVSFVDDRNVSTIAVQFVLTTEPIEKPEPEPEPEAEEEELSIIDRFLALFR